MGSTNENLHAAKSVKNDEFYTRMSEIENEVAHYRDFLRGKTILCNCNDATVSNFSRYFDNKFIELGLNKVISIGYNANSKGIIKISDKSGSDLSCLEGDGDFRSEECIKYLKQADVVITNPPFSLFREYISQLMRYEKKFLLIGNMNAITYKEVFPFIKENKMWLGISLNGTKCSFIAPKEYVGKNTYDEGGIHYAKVNNAIWFTNIKHSKRNNEIELTKKYIDGNYPKYDNYDAIEVAKICNIPMDYYGVMGVPITFLYRYSPNQFEIIKFRKGDDDKDLVYTDENGERVQPYFRILVRLKKKLKNESESNKNW